MGNEKEIVLSVEETNALRLELGLAPLRVSGVGEGTSSNSNSDDGLHNVGDKEQLSLSVQDTNVLRAQLGLKPLSVAGSRDDNNRPAEDAMGRKASEAIHAPASNTGVEKETRERIETARLKREVEQRLQTMQQTVDDEEQADNANDTTGGTALSWAEKMRTASTKKKKKKKGTIDSRNRMSIPSHEEEEAKEYGDKDLDDLAVAHSAADFELGHTTILTLADADVTKYDDGNVLENVNMRDHQLQKDHLREKRMVEMGMGHAGGYAGYDDDEFEELGGSQQATLQLRSGDGNNNNNNNSKRSSNMKLGDLRRMTDDSNNTSSNNNNDLFASMDGKAVSLLSQKGSTIASDFMTAEEKDTEEQERREKKRQKKLFKKMKKDKKRKEKRNHRRRKNDNDSDDDDKESDSDQDDGGGNKATDNMATEGQGGSLLDDLENTAVGKQVVTKPRKRRRYDDDDDDDDAMEDVNTISVSQTSTKPADTDIKAGSQGEENGKGKDDFGDAALEKKRAKFDKIMEKGNARTDAVFGSKVNTGGARKNTVQKTESKNTNIGNNEEEEEEDDAFLNAALAKARRLQRLRELNAKSNAGVSRDNDSKLEPSHQKKPKGAEAVVQAMQAMQNMSDNNKSKESQPNKGITFEFDETREFTRALRARAEQVERLNARKKQLAAGVAISTAKKTNLSEEEKRSKRQQEVEVEDVTMEELAAEVSQNNNDEDEDDDDEQVEQDDSGGGFDAPIGRGMSNVLSMLRHTGEITGKKAGKEELRGRAKDKRTYEDYAALDLKKVVKIDRSNPGINEKDLEFANREIKLEYRDEHGRLLTRHEAFRQMSYQFHGHGSSKKNEERRMRQIEREHAEGTLASRMDGSGRNGEGKGTLGALKATQRATGKAFVVHKT